MAVAVYWGTTRAEGVAVRGGEVRDLRTVADVAATMQVSPMTVDRLVKCGALRALRVGRSFRIPDAAVREYLDGARDEAV